MSEASGRGPWVRFQWWQIEPDSSAENNTMGQCIDEKLQPFLLRVSGNSGCNRYTQGEPAHRKGPSERPPSAEAAR